MKKLLFLLLLFFNLHIFFSEDSWHLCFCTTAIAQNMSREAIDNVLEDDDDVHEEFECPYCHEKFSTAANRDRHQSTCGTNYRTEYEYDAAGNRIRRRIVLSVLMNAQKHDGEDSESPFPSVECAVCCLLAKREDWESADGVASPPDGSGLDGRCHPVQQWPKNQSFA